jgi:uncharacterized membrane protein
MTSSGDTQQRGGLMSSLNSNPAVSGLKDAAKDYARAKSVDAAKKVGEKLSGVTGRLDEQAEGGGFKATAAGDAVRRVVQGENPVKAAVGGVGAGIKEKVSGLFGRSKSGGAGGNKKFVSIIEDINVGVPVDVAYNQWTQFQEFASFMKGVDSVDQTDDIESNWRVKVFKSRRNWKASITEQIPDRRIAWTSEGAKGTTKGVVTFHPLADDLTQVLLVLEYYPQGLFEKTGNIWRAGGRRARLDLKHFRRFLMMRGEETGSWRGEIRDGEVVRGPEDEEGAEEQPGEIQGRAEEEGEETDAEEADRDEAEQETEEPEEEPEEEPAEESEREPEPAGAR